MELKCTQQNDPPSRVAAPPSITIFDSELRAIAETSCQWPGCETGGDLFGWYTRRGTPVVVLATPPGPKAVHERHHFAQDLEYLRHMISILEQHYGLLLLGSYHSHHELGLTGPSSGDLKQVSSITSRNRLSRWAELIITHPPSSRASQASCSTGSPRGRLTDHIDTVHVSAFVYECQERVIPVACPLRVLDRTSPIREALISGGQCTPLASQMPSKHACVPHIAFSRTVANGVAIAEPIHRLPAVASQLETLPETVSTTLQIIEKADRVLIVLPLADGGEAIVSCKEGAEYFVNGVFLLSSDTGNTVDVSASTLIDGPQTPLAVIHERLLVGVTGLVSGDVTGCESDQRRTTGHAVNVSRVLAMYLRALTRAYSQIRRRWHVEP